MALTWVAWRSPDWWRWAHLIGQAVQGARQAGEAGGEGEVRVAERAADQVGGVRRHVAALVVPARRRGEGGGKRRSIIDGRKRR